MVQDIIFIRHFGIKRYEYIFNAMQNFTNQRNDTTPDEIWLVEHFPVFTQGKAGGEESLFIPRDIPLIQSNRGGKITYHGPGQQIMYVLFDLKRRRLSVCKLIMLLEQAVINMLDEFGINAYSRVDAPGVYVGEMKICSLGLHVQNGYSSHGLALNVSMDLSPFLHINPCGYIGMKMTQMLQWVKNITPTAIRPYLITKFLGLLKNPPYEWISSGLKDNSSINNSIFQT